tara:strand:- start:3000 stop:4592 length:1593 start_codon:yes stop_codon:yes gene_type:complete
MSYSTISNSYVDKYLSTINRQVIVRENFEINKFENHIYILIPCYNFGEYIKECLDSIYKENYNNFTCVIVDDGSTDNTYDIISDYITMYNNIVLLSYDINRGPAFGKYIGFMKIREICNPNDIVMIVDGDDYLMNNALNEINTTYNNYKCLFTYGSCTGEYCDQTSTVKDITNYRKEKWMYSHPRTFKCILLYFFKESDFKYIDNTWLQKGTDRNFVYKCLELSQNDRIHYINKNIYFYRSHQNNAHKLLDFEFRKKQIDYTINQRPLSRFNETIHILMCSWKRVKYLHKIIKSIIKQDTEHPIIFHIVNNNINENENISNIISQFKYPNRNIILHNNNENLYGYSRFLKTRELLNKYYMDYILFIDDDQELPTNYVSRLYNLREPNTYKMWYGRDYNKKLFKMKDSDAKKEIDRKLDIIYDVRFNHTDLVKGLKKDIRTFTYGGTGGCIIDTRIFLFDELYTLEDEYKNIEDVWLSYICYKNNWKIKRSYVLPNFLDDGRGDGKAQFLSMDKYHKYNFIKKLINSGWKI